MKMGVTRRRMPPKKETPWLVRDGGDGKINEDDVDLKMVSVMMMFLFLINVFTPRSERARGGGRLETITTFHKFRVL